MVVDQLNVGQVVHANNFLLRLIDLGDDVDRHGYLAASGDSSWIPAGNGTFLLDPRFMIFTRPFATKESMVSNSSDSRRILLGHVPNLALICLIDL